MHHHHPGIPFLYLFVLSSVHMQQPYYIAFSSFSHVTNTPLKKKHYSKIQSSKNLYYYYYYLYPFYSHQCILKIVFQKYPHHFTRKKDKKIYTRHQRCYIFIPTHENTSKKKVYYSISEDVNIKYSIQQQHTINNMASQSLLWLCCKE